VLLQQVARVRIQGWLLCHEVPANTLHVVDHYPKSRSQSLTNYCAPSSQANPNRDLAINLYRQPFLRGKRERCS
jgi:hypothetical protein